MMRCKSHSDTDLYKMSLRKNILQLLKKYLNNYKILLDNFKSNNHIEMSLISTEPYGKKKKISSFNILMSEENVFIYEHANIVVGYYIHLDNFLNFYKGDAFYDSGDDTLIFTMEKDTPLYQYCLRHYEDIFIAKLPLDKKTPDIKVYLKLYQLLNDDYFFALDT